MQAVSAGHPEAVAAAEEIFTRGGNAVDAAVATAFAISVVEPVASGIGGGGAALVHPADGAPTFFDYREVVNNQGELPANRTGIPGFTAGMSELHRRYGGLDWEQVLAPGIRLAHTGFIITDYLQARLQHPKAPAWGLGAGERLQQPELGETLERLAHHGWQEIYTGELAASLANAVEGIDADSLAAYRVHSAPPVRGSFADLQLLSAAAPLPGAMLIQLLQIAQAHGVGTLEPGSADWIDLLCRAQAQAEKVLHEQMGDPRFVTVPVEEIIDPQRNAVVELPDSGTHPNTTHISVVDEQGMVVSMTNTITDFWGSGQCVDGYFINNAFIRFPEFGSPANRPEPGKRSVSWSCPSIVLDAAGKPILPIGTPGGTQIIPSLASVLTQWGLQSRSLQEAITEPRFRPHRGRIYLEAGHPEVIGQQLERLGWEVTQWPSTSFGSIQSVEITQSPSGSRLTSADDPRRDGAHRISN
ncbi:hypothetical protein HGQ17_00945 [Nesterenkonia sp. MY13]|uniref:Gamma-glutamyltransferase n=1 Tax=Nesterenkonia sedimenti TaxID=1463632 RepID=A0A7X8THN4_9MICC|nr:gamma-glutamyltransferase [Nesterenkonia sedimenti]NLS08595.1 hypothetical protein [Nesterenkonia sedimenti]